MRVTSRSSAPSTAFSRCSKSPASPRCSPSTTPWTLLSPPSRPVVEVLELEIPARPEFVALVRLVVSSVASTRRVLAEERIDDIKLAVSEACTNAIEAHDAVARDEHVVVRLVEGDDRLEI